MFPHGLPMATSELAQAPLHPMYGQYSFGQSPDGFNPDSVNWLPADAEHLLGIGQPSMSVDAMAYPESAFGMDNMLMNGLDALNAMGPMPQESAHQPQPSQPVLHPFPMGNSVDGSFGAQKESNFVADLQLESMNMWSNAPTTWEYVLVLVQVEECD